MDGEGEQKLAFPVLGKAGSRRTSVGRASAGSAVENPDDGKLPFPTLGVTRTRTIAIENTENKNQGLNVPLS